MSLTSQEFLKRWVHRIKPSEKEELISDVKELLKPPAHEILVETVVSHRDMRPIVNCKMGSFEFQVTPEQARKIGADFLEVGGNAETDAFIYQFFGRKMGIPMEQVASFLAALREWRRERAKALEQPTSGQVKQ